jgi:DNA polymerase III epsilon subunit-like protein
MSVGGFTLGSVIIPGAATQASRGCEGAASAGEAPAGEGLAGEVRTGERLARLRLVSPSEAVEARPDGQDASGRGVNGRELDGPWGERRLGRELAGWGGPDLRGGAGLGSLGETELSRVEFVVVDLETTGWSPEVAAITEIAAVRVTGAGAVGWGTRRRGSTGTRRSNGAAHADGRGDRAGHGGRSGDQAGHGGRSGDRAGQAEGARQDGRAGARREFVRLGEFASLVNPGVPVPPGIAELTGINDSMLAAAPRLGAVLPRLLEFSRGSVLVAHNAPFDLRFLVAASTDCGVAWPGFTVLDTVMLARRVMDPDEVADCKLGTLAGFFGARTAPSHRALADARATADVLSWLVRRLEHRGIRTIQQLSAWPDVVA